MGQSDTFRQVSKREQGRLTFKLGHFGERVWGGQLLRLLLLVPGLVRLQTQRQLIGLQRAGPVVVVVDDGRVRRRLWLLSLTLCGLEIMRSSFQAESGRLADLPPYHGVVTHLLQDQLLERGLG